MTPWLESVVELVIGGTIGILVKYLLDSLKEWRDGKKDEAQRMLKRVEFHKARADQMKYEYDYLRAWVLAPGRLTSEQLKELPEPPAQEKE